MAVHFGTQPRRTEDPGQQQKIVNPTFVQWVMKQTSMRKETQAPIPLAKDSRWPSPALDSSEHNKEGVAS